MAILETGKFYIQTFGCQMNVADSERMSVLLAAQGLAPTDAPEKAEVIIVNGCSVREKAVHKALSALGRANVLKRKAEGRGPLIGIGGCVGQLEKDTLFSQAPYVDFIFGTDNIDQLPEMVYRVRNGERKLKYTDFDARTTAYSTDTKVLPGKAQAFVNIMKGCDKFCTYCIVPFTRGREKSRTIDEVVSDVARMVASGVREVTLLGQNVNSFGKGNPNVGGREPRELHNAIGPVGPRAGEENFPQLLRALDTDPRCSGLRRIRFTSSTPLDFSDELIECYRPAHEGGVARLARQLHLPVQSGSDRILKKMGRHHPIEAYVAQMNRLKTICPDVGLSTDMIVGFPTETEEDFQASLSLLDTIRYDQIYAFAYSPRPGTRAAKMEDDVPDPVKNERLNRLLAHQTRIAEERYRSRVGRRMSVLVENEARNRNLARGEDGRVSLPEGARVWTGRSECNRVVNFIDSGDDSGRNLVGRFVDVAITGATSLSLQGELVHDAHRAERGSGGVSWAHGALL